MNFLKSTVLATIIVLVGLVSNPNSGLSVTPVIKCGDISALSFEPNVTIESAAMVQADKGLPEHCLVKGVIWPELKMMVKLPTKWNERFYMVGNGGSGRPIFEGAMIPALIRGYATAGENTGHKFTNGTDWSFSWPSKDNPYAAEKSEHFIRTGVHLTTLLAKKIIKVYYGQSSQYNYYAGCSNGGRQGLIEAQHYPEDFDGLLIGAPAADTVGFTLSHTWEQQALLGRGAIPNSKLSILSKAVYQKCDSLDGLSDGLVTNPRGCDFVATRDLPQCYGKNDGSDCFTGDQLEALRKIFSGPTTSTGKRLYVGQPLGASVMVPGPGGRPMSGWLPFLNFFVPEKPSIGEMFASSLLKYFMFKKPPGPNYNWKTFDFDTDSRKLVAFDSTSPDMRTLKKRGGKIIQYHGWADAVMNPYQSTNYYWALIDFFGEKSINDFYRLYMIPGMFHCRGGVGCDNVDWLTAIRKWVEEGIAPGTMIGKQVVKGKTVRTRPHCLYPKVAKYTGSGDSSTFNDAKYFACVYPE